MNNLWDMTGRGVLVTGASSGIGRATALLLSELGANVWLTGRDSERLAETASLLHGEGHVTAPFELAQVDAIPGWVKALTAEHGPLAGIAHCAGLQLTYPLRATTWDHVDGLMRLNVGAALALARGFRQRGVCDGKGSLVLLSSAAGLVGEPARAAYSASKAAVIGLTRSLAVELARDGIRVNCVAPGVVETPMWEETQRTLTPEQVQEITLNHPLGLGEARDVASAIAFLLSDAGKWITGTTMVVDGGFIAGR